MGKRFVIIREIKNGESGKEHNLKQLSSKLGFYMGCSSIVIELSIL